MYDELVLQIQKNLLVEFNNNLNCEFLSIKGQELREQHLFSPDCFYNI